MIIRPSAVAAFAAVLVTAMGAGPARAYHELDCGPLRPVITNEATGRRYCGPVSPQVRDQLQRARQLRQAQQRRVRALRIKQLQRTRALELISQRQAAGQPADQDHESEQASSASGRRPDTSVRGVLKLPPPVPYRREDLKKIQAGP